MRIFRFLLPLLSLLLLISLSILSALQIAFKRVAPLEGLGSKEFNMGITQNQPEKLQSNMETGLFRYKGYQDLAYKNDPDNPESLVQPLFTTKASGEGTGLELSLSYEIITNGQGGKLQVKPEKDEHAKFIITLPVRGLTVAESATM